MRRALALTVVVLALAGPALAPAAPALAQQSPTPRPKASASAVPSASLTVSDLLPRAPRPGDPFQVLGTLRNSGTVDLTGVQVRIQVGDRIDSRGKLALADRSTTLAYESRGQFLDVVDLVRPGETAPVDLRMSVDDLDLGRAGVYPIRLQVRAQDSRGNRVVVAEEHSYLPWFAADQVDPLRIAWVLPLVDQPRAAPDEQFVDDSLAGALGTGGRLGELLSTGRAGEQGKCAPEPAVEAGQPPAIVPPERQRCVPTPVTYAVDPELLDEAQTMTGPYQIRGGTPGSGSSAAAAWLTSLKAAVSGGAGLVTLPFGDPDVVAMTAGGGELSGDYATASTYGADVAKRVLGGAGLTGIALPPPGPVTDQALDALGSSGSKAVVLDETALVADRTLRATPGTRAALPATSSAQPLTGLVVDAGLTALLTPTPGQSARLAEQRWLVETAMISAETPNAGRTLLIAPPRRGTVDRTTVTAALQDTGRLPWMCGVSLQAVAAGTEACPGQQPPDHGPDRNGRLAAADAVTAAALRPLPATMTQRTLALRTAANQFTGAILIGGTDAASATRGRLQRAVLRTVSSAWRDRPEQGVALATLLDQDIQGQVGRIVLRTNRVLLTSKSSKLQVAVINELDQPVRIQVRLTAPTSAQLSTNGPATVEIPARSSFPVSFDAQTQTSGRFAVRAELLDQNGVPFGTPSELRVRSTRYGTVALAVTGIAAGVLLVAAGYRVTRRAMGKGKPLR